MFKHKFSNSHSWRIDEDSGFLRVTANLAKAGVMQYGRDELESQGITIPAHITNDMINVLLPPSALQNESFLKSIEGSDATFMHEWQDTDTNAQRIGSFAGVPKFENEFLSGDFIIKEKNSIEAIKKSDLKELSSAYASNKFTFENGNYNGTDYQAVQDELTYNHTAFLPEGYGRGGKEVRILNNKGKTMETVKVRLSNMGMALEVPADQVEAIEALDAKFANMVDKTELETVQADLTKANTTIQLKDEEIKELKSVDRIMNQAKELNQITEQSNKILNSRGIKLENMGVGMDAKKAVVAAVRVQNKNDALTETQLASDDVINTMFDMYAEQEPTKIVKIANATKTKDMKDDKKVDDKEALWGNK